MESHRGPHVAEISLSPLARDPLIDKVSNVGEGPSHTRQTPKLLPSPHPIQNPLPQSLRILNNLNNQNKASQLIFQPITPQRLHSQVTKPSLRTYQPQTIADQVALALTSSTSRFKNVQQTIKQSEPVLHAPRENLRPCPDYMVAPRLCSSMSFIEFFKDELLVVRRDSRHSKQSQGVTWRGDFLLCKGRSPKGTRGVSLLSGNLVADK